MTIYFRLFLANLYSAMEYRAAFLAQVVFMMINNAFIVAVWYVFFLRFGTIGGLDFGNYVLLQALMGLTFGVQHLFFAGYWSIAWKIRDGVLDSELLLPGSPLLRMVMAKLDISAVGDVLFSIAIFVFLYSYATPGSFLVFLLTGILGGIVITSFVAFCQILTFFFGDTDELSGGVFELILSPAMYPPAILENFSLKFLFYSVFPVFFVVWLPADLTRSFDWEGMAMLSAFTAFSVASTFALFRYGLRRYESGNLMTTRR